VYNPRVHLDGRGKKTEVEMRFSQQMMNNPGIWDMTQNTQVHWHDASGQFTASIFKTAQQRYFLDYPEGG